MIEIYLLEQLKAFHDCGTLSAASEQLHLSQPALSRSMKKMEEILGVTLFERQKNKIALNENGMMAAGYSAKILEQEKEPPYHHAGGLCTSPRLPACSRVVAKLQ